MTSLTEARFGDQRATDPNVEEFLADPMVRLLMVQDRIHVDDARRLYADAAQRIRSRRGRHGVRVTVARGRETALSA
jgi:hypothetical protein